MNRPYLILITHSLITHKNCIWKAKIQFGQRMVKFAEYKNKNIIFVCAQSLKDKTKGMLTP